MLNNLKTGLLYRNPTPHLRSVHAYFPSAVVLPDGDLLATVVLDEAFEAVNLSTYLVRSKDNGDTWKLEGQQMCYPHFAVEFLERRVFRRVQDGCARFP